MSDNLFFALTMFGCIVLIITVLLVTGCSSSGINDVTSETCKGTNGEPRQLTGMPEGEREYPALTDSLYSPVLRSWIIPAPEGNPKALFVTNGRGMWFAVEEWDVQAINYFADRIEVMDTCRYLHLMHYRIER